MNGNSEEIKLKLTGCEALKAADIVEVLDTLVENAWTEEAKDCARGALMQLTDRRHEAVAEIDLDALHIMMSCECTLAFCLVSTGTIV